MPFVAALVDGGMPVRQRLRPGGVEGSCIDSKALYIPAVQCCERLAAQTPRVGGYVIHHVIMFVFNFTFLLGRALGCQVSLGGGRGSHMCHLWSS